MWNFDKIIPALIPGVIYRLAVIDLVLIPGVIYRLALIDLALITGVTLCIFF